MKLSYTLNVVEAMEKAKENKILQASGFADGVVMIFDKQKGHVILDVNSNQTYPFNMYQFKLQKFRILKNKKESMREMI